MKTLTATSGRSSFAQRAEQRLWSVSNHQGVATLSYSLARQLLSNPIIKETNWVWGTKEDQERYMAIWLRDKFQCVYCDRDMLESYDTHYWFSHIDHLLPRSYEKYKELQNVKWNRVLSCCSCNGLKKDFDPDSESKLYVQGSLTTSDANREFWLTKARDFVTALRDARTKHFELEKALLRSVQLN